MGWIIITSKETLQIDIWHQSLRHSNHTLKMFLNLIEIDFIAMSRKDFVLGLKVVVQCLLNKDFSKEISL